MGRARRGGGASRTSQLLLVALGAVAGLAIGMAVADRAGGPEGLLRRKSSRRQRRHRDDGWRGDERRSQPFEDAPEDDAELAPEAISHLHLRGRYPETPAAGVEAQPDLEPYTPTELNGPARPTAEEIEERVLEVFRNDPILAERNIDIGADHHGRVELTGWVEAPSEVAHAETLVRGVPQVTGVVSNLMIRRRATG